MHQRAESVEVSALVRRTQPGLIARSYRLADDEVCLVRGLRVTTAARTAFDIERLALLEAAGWMVIRISAEMMKRPHVIIQRVRTALIDRGLDAHK